MTVTLTYYGPNDQRGAPVVIVGTRGPAWTQEQIDELTALLDAASVANYSATSTTSLTIGPGAKSLVVQDGKMFVAGTYVLIADAAAPTTNWMYGQVTSYDFETGDLDVDVQRELGAGTVAAWLISLSGPQGIGWDALPSFTGNAGKMLVANATEDGAEWLQEGWRLIGTLSPSAATTATFTAIKALGYNDLMINYALTLSGSGSMGILLSADGTTFSSSVSISSSSTSTRDGAVVIFGAQKPGGVMIAGDNTTSSLSVSATGAPTWSWRVVGGLDAARITCTGANMTGTIELYGRM